VRFMPCPSAIRVPLSRHPTDVNVTAIASCTCLDYRFGTVHMAECQVRQIESSRAAVLPQMRPSKKEPAGAPRAQYQGGRMNAKL
jgi:hypothetical protein